MSDVDLKKYLPDTYNEIVEVEAQQDALSIEINKLQALYEQALMDQFVQYASIKVIGYYEAIFHIVANPEIESLEFRRERVLSRMKSLTPPYTYYYLRILLDGYFGKDKYKLDINNNEFTIYLESSAEDSLWYHEIQVTITAIKPCNMIFINKPRVQINMLTNEQVNFSKYTRHYRLDGTWLLGLRPFVTETGEEIIKMPYVKSIQPLFIQNSFDCWNEHIQKVKLNDSIIVTELNKQIVDSQLEISYGVNVEQLEGITNIKLLDIDENILCGSNVFIPIEDYVIIKHILKLEEGVNANK